MNVTTILKNISRLLVIALLLIGKQSHAQLWWGDEFSGTTLNTSNWNVDQGGGGFGNNELQYYLSNNVVVGNNCLQLIAKRENYGGNAYTSGKITSFNKRHWGSGWIEGRMSIPMGQGLWPAFWMLGINIGSVGWPACGEIDIMEHINNEGGVHGTIHWDAGGHVSYGGYGSTSPSGWHNYQVNWNNYGIKWYIDGVQYWAANTTNNINSTEEFHRDFFIILNLAVGGNWPGSPNSGTPFPSTLWVDYVRVYQPSAAARVAAGGDEDTERKREPGVIATEGNNDEGGISVYPNPSVRQQALNVKVDKYDATALVNVALVDITGKVLNVQTDNKQVFTVPVQKVATGTYFLKVTNGTHSYVKKVLLQ
ncbi:MAG: family 16 glycosylhydrolase [Chitinophagaceae bacterium]